MQPQVSEWYPKDMQGDHKQIYEAVKEIDRKVDAITIDVAVLKAQRTEPRLRELELDQAEQRGRARRNVLGAGGVGGALAVIIQHVIGLLR